MKIHVPYEYEAIYEWLYFAPPSLENQLLDEIDSKTFPRSSLPLDKMQRYHGLEMKGIIQIRHIDKTLKHEHKMLDKLLSQLPMNCSTDDMRVS